MVLAGRSDAASSAASAQRAGPAAGSRPEQPAAAAAGRRRPSRRPSRAGSSAPMAAAPAKSTTAAPAALNVRAGITRLARLSRRLLDPRAPGAGRLPSAAAGPGRKPGADAGGALRLSLGGSDRRHRRRHPARPAGDASRDDPDQPQPAARCCRSGTIPEMFWYQRGLRYTLSAQPGEAPLVMIIPGTGAGPTARLVDVLSRIFYAGGYHVLAVPSPTFSNFAVTASSTGVPGPGRSRRPRPAPGASPRLRRGAEPHPRSRTTTSRWSATASAAGTARSSAGWTRTRRSGRWASAASS